jgi:hypothetical protein
MRNDDDYIRLTKQITPSVIAASSLDPSQEKMREQARAIGAEFTVISAISTPSTSQIAKLIKLE